jgi:hypothetical protein
MLALTLGIQAIDMYIADDPSIESMKLSTTEWEILKSIECVLEVCS